MLPTSVKLSLGIWRALNAQNENMSMEQDSKMPVNFPGSPAAEILGFQCTAPRLDPRSGN